MGDAYYDMLAKIGLNIVYYRKEKGYTQHQWPNGHRTAKITSNRSRRRRPRPV